MSSGIAFAPFLLQQSVPNPGVLSPYSNTAEGGSYEGNRIFRSRV